MIRSQLFILTKDNNFNFLLCSAFMRMPLNLSETVAGADSDTIKSKGTLMYITELGQAVPLYIVLL